MNDLFTIVYYTSNREDEAFEQKVKDRLLKVCGDIPIISVSQKPIDLGRNICVGNVGACDHNLFRQIYLGCKAATTPYIISCEADCIYPPDYFRFVPDGTCDYYRFGKLYILNKWGKPPWEGYFFKYTAPFAQITKKEYWIRELDRCFADKPEWKPDGNKHKLPLFLQRDWKYVELPNPIISLKTGQGMRKHTEVHMEEMVNKVPFFGEAETLRKELWPA